MNSGFGLVAAAMAIAEAAEAARRNLSPAGVGV